MPPRPWRTALEIEVLCSLNKSHLFSLVSLWFLDAAHFLFAFTFEVHIFQHFPPIQMFPCLQVKMLQNPHSYRHFSYVIWILKHHCATVLSFILNKNHCYWNKVGGSPPRVHALKSWSQCHGAEVVKLLGENQMMGIPCSQVTNIVFKRRRSFLRQKIVLKERALSSLSLSLSSSPTTHGSAHFTHSLLTSSPAICHLPCIFSHRTPAHIMMVGYPRHQSLSKINFFIYYSVSWILWQHKNIEDTTI